MMYSATGSFAAWIGVRWIADAAAERDKFSRELNFAFIQLEEQSQQSLTL